jgi:hypothetical protein
MAHEASSPSGKCPGDPDPLARCHRKFGHTNLIESQGDEGSAVASHTSARTQRIVHGVEFDTRNPALLSGSCLRHYPSRPKSSS